jgi:hypothetical protein
MRAALPFVSPRVYAAGIWFEALLAVWLLSGLAPAWSWLSAVGFFTVLAYLSARLGFLGQTSCGCFGKLVVSPWWALAIDVACLTALIAWRPRAIGAGIVAGLPAAGIGAAIVAALLGIQTWRHGSLPSALAQMRGETIVVSPAVASAGEGRGGTSAAFPLVLTNYGKTSARIVGGTSDCSCVATDDLPFELGPGESRSMTVRLKFTGSPGEFRRRFVLYADENHLCVMPVAVTGRVVE